MECTISIISPLIANSPLSRALGTLINPLLTKKNASSSISNLSPLVIVTAEFLNTDGKGTLTIKFGALVTIIFGDLLKLKLVKTFALAAIISEFGEIRSYGNVSNEGKYKTLLISFLSTRNLRCL